MCSHFFISPVGRTDRTRAAPGLRTSTATLPRCFEAAREGNAWLNRSDPLRTRPTDLSTRQTALGRPNYPCFILPSLMFVVVAPSFLVRISISFECIKRLRMHKKITRFIYENANDASSLKCLKLKMVISRISTSVQ